jgi:hypothetical protein
MALTVVDRAIQSFGAEGVSQDQQLAEMWAGLRTLRIADVCVFDIYIHLSVLTCNILQGPDAV